MNKLKIMKATLVVVWLVGVLLFVGGSAFKSHAADGKDKQKSPPPATQKENPADYVGTETCETCHDKQAHVFAHTAHAAITKEASWKGKVTGCESCHGPGKAHVELVTSLDEKSPRPDDMKIRNFHKISSKEASETCLQCHSGREEHNNFRRGEHWRNDVGCTDCHTAHSSPAIAENKAGSNVFVSRANGEKPGFADEKLLKIGEPQLCMSCHTETKHQFNQPFHHKVLEGAMKCSDCHNPHGGFETKQTRLATGTDAACLKCHADKQGPFAYEHAPVKTEGCASCHTPHGSANPRLLRTSTVSQLCIECHTQAHGVGAQEPGGPQHNLNLQYANCTVCHVKIHGSHTSPVFFR
ncbi:MAG: hypothetical protein QOE33_3380 [Acidobacteriota bacterium]|nr:hypothetical protein [Acidobacteriota bacterium]